MRLHVVSLPHTQTTEDYLTCAYTQKVVKFGKMMRPLGHEVYLYGGDENEAECDEFISVVSTEERERWFEDHTGNNLPTVTWNPWDEPWRVMNARVIEGILTHRESERDLVLLIAGLSQEPIAKGLPDMIACEWGVGYEGIFSNFCAFESHAWRQYLYGKRHWGDGRWYDATIPNFFDRDAFSLAREKDDYILFIGRLIQRKGLVTANEVAKRTGRRLVVAGAGATHVEDGKIVAPEVTIEGDHLVYAGPVDSIHRNILMSRAAATIVPTQYIEPFGGVAIESMLAGTPVLTTDWGAFTETVEPGLTGYRFHTLADGAAKLEQVIALDPVACRERAIERYSLEAVAPQFDRWFEQLAGLYGKGWYS